MARRDRVNPRDVHDIHNEACRSLVPLCPRAWANRDGKNHLVTVQYWLHNSVQATFGVWLLRALPLLARAGLGPGLTTKLCVCASYEIQRQAGEVFESSIQKN